jgi:F-type H+-transporting ATPase subunit b
MNFISYIVDHIKVNESALITINETLVIQLISFLIFLFLINRIMFRPLCNAMQQREKHIDGLTNGINNSKNQLVKMDKELQIHETAAIKEASQRKDSLEEDGTRHANEIIEEARKEIQGLKEKSQQYIDAQIKQARTSLKEESEKLAVKIMEKILDRGMAQ